MGHYRSEMMSQSEIDAEEAAIQKHQHLMEEGGKALRDVFGDKAEAVVYFIAQAAGAEYEHKIESACEHYMPKPK